MKIKKIRVRCRHRTIRGRVFPRQYYENRKWGICVVFLIGYKETRVVWACVFHVKYVVFNVIILLLPRFFFFVLFERKRNYLTVIRAQSNSVRATVLFFVDY